MSAVLRFTKMVAATFAVGVTLSAPADGSELPDTHVFGYLRAKAVANRLYIAAVMSDAYLGRWCDEGRAKYRTKVTNYLGRLDQVRFDKSLVHPLEGSWTVRFSAEACGSKRIYNALFQARTRRVPLMLRWFAGTTDAPPRLARDLQPFLQAHTASARAAFLKSKDKERTDVDAKSCRDVRVLDTEVVVPLAPDVRDRIDLAVQWREAWTVSACGVVIVLPITFSRAPGRQGTSFSITSPGDVEILGQDAGMMANPAADRVALEAVRRQRQEGDIASAVAEIRRAAKSNGAFAQYLLAVYYMEGYGVPRNYNNVNSMAYWALRSAYNGYPRAMHLVGTMYLWGIFFERDYQMANVWFRRSAAAGEPSGEHEVRWLINTGWVDADPPPKVDHGLVGTSSGAMKDDLPRDQMR